MKYLKSERGFTLLELLMVVIIIAILVSVALPQYIRATERARTAQIMPLLASTQQSEIRFKAQDAGALYTTTLANLDITQPATVPAAWGGLAISGVLTGGADVFSNRSAAVAGSPTPRLTQDLDTSNICAAGGTAALDNAVGLVWGLPSAGGDNDC